MDKQRRDFVNIVEDQAVPPCDNRTCDRTMRETITRDKQPCTLGEEPYVEEVENKHVVTEVEEEIVPCTLFVAVDTHWQ